MFAHLATIWICLSAFRSGCMALSMDLEVELVSVWVDEGNLYGISVAVVPGLVQVFAGCLLLGIFGRRRKHL